ncbi:Copia protein, partial [Mucuna pruriens]
MSSFMETWKRKSTWRFSHDFILVMKRTRYADSKRHCMDLNSLPEHGRVKVIILSLYNIPFMRLHIPNKVSLSPKESMYLISSKKQENWDARPQGYLFNRTIGLGVKKVQPKKIDFQILYVSGRKSSKWRSKKQNVVAQSNAEAEFQAMTHGICKGLWMKIIFYDLKGPMKLFCDNNSAISITLNLVQHDRTKHIEIDENFKEKLDNGLIFTCSYEAPSGRCFHLRAPCS